MKPVIIGVGHKARNGKDTACSHIVKTFGDKYNIAVVPFAAALKEEVNDLDQEVYCMENNIPYDNQPDKSDPLCQTKHFKQPKLLQFYGQLKKEENPFYWINKVKSAVQDLPKDTHFVLIPDLRYKTEYLWVRSERGHTVKVTRLGYVDPSRDPNHISEVDLDNVTFDYEINVQDGDVDQLLKDAEEVFSLIYQAENPIHEVAGTYGVI